MVGEGGLLRLGSWFPTSCLTLVRFSFSYGFAGGGRSLWEGWGWGRLSDNFVGLRSLGFLLVQFICTWSRGLTLVTHTNKVLLN